MKNRKGGNISLRLTQEWLRSAHNDMLAHGSLSLSHPRPPSGHLKYATLSRNQQIYLAVLRGLLGLVFNSPSHASSSSMSTPPTPVSSTPIHPLTSQNVYPEALYLDVTRLGLLSSEAADATALCMLLLLYRQLVFSEINEASSSPQGLPRVVDSDLVQLKREIRDIGPSRLAHCFASPSDGHDSPRGSRSDKQESERWLNARQGIVLQIAKRAKEARSRTHASSTSQPYSLVRDAPDAHTTSLAQRWVHSNMHADSTLAVMMRRRLQEVVFNTVVKLTYPTPDSSTTKLGVADFLASARAYSEVELPFGAATGMEPLADEIRALAEKISRLALIHLNAFLPLYEQEGFLALS